MGSLLRSANYRDIFVGVAPAGSIHATVAPIANIAPMPFPSLETPVPATLIDAIARRFRSFVADSKGSHGAAPEPNKLERIEIKPSASPTDEAGSLTKDGDSLRRSVQDRSYFLWQEAGEPAGRADEFWRQSLTEHLSQRALATWEKEGRPVGKADDHWYRACRDLEQAGLR